MLFELGRFITGKHRGYFSPLKIVFLDENVKFLYNYTKYEYMNHMTKNHHHLLIYDPLFGKGKERDYYQSGYSTISSITPATITPIKQDFRIASDAQEKLHVIAEYCTGMPVQRGTKTGIVDLVSFHFGFGSIHTVDDHLRIVSVFRTGKY